MTALPQVSATAERDQLDTAFPLFLRQCNKIDVTPAGGNKLLRLHLFQCIDLVTKHGGRFINLRLCRPFHARNQAGHDFLVFALQEQGGVIHLCCVIFTADQADTRRGTTPDLVLQAGPVPVGEITVFTISKAEQFLDQVDAFTHRSS